MIAQMTKGLANNGFKLTHSNGVHDEYDVDGYS